MDSSNRTTDTADALKINASTTSISIEVAAAAAAVAAVVEVVEEEENKEEDLIPIKILSALYVNDIEGPSTKYIVIKNDDSPQNLVWLVSLKEIFARQLPKMPKDYIARLVLDRKHLSMLILRNGIVVGGICFRPFMESKFAEIVFCAISANNQVKGYGTRLMNQLKEYVKTVNLTHFLTYADNYAIGYFKKQGFSKVIGMQKERWHGFIKDYDGGTLMECAINQHVNYLHIPEMIAKQRIELQQNIKRLSHFTTVYPGLSPESRQLVPGLIEGGWSHPSSNSGLVRKSSPLQIQLRGILDQITEHEDSWPFLEPVPDSVPNYKQIVKKPIDLSLIRKRIEAEDFYYKTLEDMQNDLQLMCDNCTTFNAPDTDYYMIAERINVYINSLFAEVRAYNNRSSLQDVDF